MQNDWLETWLTRWGAWCETGTIHNQQVTSWLRHRRGVFKGGAAFETEGDSIEYAIEKAVSNLASENNTAARVIRAEYSSRTGANQAARAMYLDMSLRTYQRNLKQAKSIVYDEINSK